MRTKRWLMVLAACVPLARLGAAEPAGEPVLERCVVSFIDEADVPALEAGVLVELLVREGDTVSKGQVIAKIDDDQPQMQLEKAQAEHKQAQAKAASDVEVRHAENMLEFAKNALARQQEANRRRPGAVSPQDIEQYQLEEKKAALSIDQAKVNRLAEALTAEAKQVEVDAAANAIERRLVKSPLDGKVEKVTKHPGEWIEPRERLAQIVRTDALRVEGNVNATEWSRDEVLGREVTVEVALERGRREKFTGRIIFVSERLEGGDEFEVHAEVTNRRGPATAVGEGGWLLRDGQKATMTIHTQKPPATP